MVYAYQSRIIMAKSYCEHIALKCYIAKHARATVIYTSMYNTMNKTLSIHDEKLFLYVYFTIFHFIFAFGSLLLALEH